MKNDIEREVLLVRAGYRCEYCKTLLADVQFEVEHVWPQSRGGTHDLGNLAIACQRCNRNKGDVVEWIDRISGATFPLFNPRTMEWAEHFKPSHNEIVGRSAIGRATASLLFRNTPQYLPPDLQWDKIAVVGDNEPLYYFLNHLRYRRLRNEFGLLFRQLTADVPEIDVNPREADVVHFAKHLLLLELYFTRSRPRDIAMGIACAGELLATRRLAPSQRTDILTALSVLHQQRATVAFDRADSASAVVDQRMAYDYHIRAYPQAANQREFSEAWRLGPQDFLRALRSATLKAKYHGIGPGRNELESCIARVADLDPFYNSSYYSYLIDLVLLDEAADCEQLQRLYAIASGMLEAEGYGSSRDYAKLIAVRRRWWILHLVLENDPDLGAFAKDLEFWNGISMFNEARELQGHLMRAGARVPSKALSAALHLCRERAGTEVA